MSRLVSEATAFIYLKASCVCKAMRNIYSIILEFGQCDEWRKHLSEYHVNDQIGSIQAGFKDGISTSSS